MAQIESLTTQAIIALINAGTWPQNFDVVTGNLTNLGTQVAVDVSLASNVVMHVKNAGSVAMTAGAFTFEGSLDSTTGIDGTWFAIQAVRSNAATTESSTGTVSLAFAAGLAYAHEASVNGMRWLRVRTTTAVTASAIARWTIVRAAYATEPAPSIQSHPVTVTGTVSTSSGSGTAFSAVGAASTNPTVIKATAGDLYELSVYNPTAATVYLKLYSKSTAPAPATDVPIAVIPVPTNSQVTMPYGGLGKRFALGIGFALVAGPANNDAVAVAAGVLVSATYI